MNDTLFAISAIVFIILFTIMLYLSLRNLNHEANEDKIKKKYKEDYLW